MPGEGGLIDQPEWLIDDLLTIAHLVNAVRKKSGNR